MAAIDTSADARSIAAIVLQRVWQDAAYATPTLDAELSRAAQLDSRERALCTQLTYGVLRCETALMQLLR
ncbi:MAG TPA: Sun protein, partial [Sorangium sp.]|nr:Sun protein [Sorangium sp.]